MEKTYSIEEFLNYSFCIYKGKHIILKLNNKYEYLQIPTIINLNINENFITFFVNEDGQQFLLKQFILSLTSFLESKKIESFVKRIKIKGLGYKIAKESGSLFLNLGYSFRLKVKLPNKIFHLIIKKNMLILKSFDKVLLGNYANFLCFLRKRNLYTGKGLLLEYNEKNLKPIKKK